MVRATGSSAGGTVDDVPWYLRPKWLALHAFVVLSTVVMVRLGIWQWHVGGIRHGDLRNYAYAAQWWAFVGFAALLWVRVLRDARRALPTAVGVAASSVPAGEPVAYPRYAMPQSAQIVVDDPELVAYNNYLASLHVQSARQAEGVR